MSRCAKCGCEKESPFDGKTVIHDESRCGSLAGPTGSAYDSFKSAIESGDIEHLLWWSDTARTLLTEVVYQHADKDSPEYNECDTSRCMWCETAAKLMPNAPSSASADPKL